MRKKIKEDSKRKLASRRRRVVKKLALSQRPQLVVNRSARHMYAQLVDPQTRQTIVSVSTLSPSVRTGSKSSGKIDAAKQVGQLIAGLAREKQIEQVVFNRNGFLYHGRVKALAEAAREAGLQF